MGPECEGLGSLKEQEIRWHTHTGGWTPMTQGGDSRLHIQELGKPSRHLDIGLPISSTRSQHVVFQSQGHYWLLPTSWTSAQQTSLSFTISWSLLRLKSIGSVMPSNLLNLCHPLLFLPSIFPSSRVFLNESFLHIRWPKYCSFSISPSNEYWGLIVFRIARFDLLPVQENIKSIQAPFFGTKLSLWSSSHICPWLLKKEYLWRSKSLMATL